MYLGQMEKILENISMSAGSSKLDGARVLGGV